MFVWQSYWFIFCILSVHFWSKPLFSPTIERMEAQRSTHTQEKNMLDYKKVHPQKRFPWSKSTRPYRAGSGRMRRWVSPDTHNQHQHLESGIFQGGWFSRSKKLNFCWWIPFLFLTTELEGVFSPCSLTRSFLENFIQKKPFPLICYQWQWSSNDYVGLANWWPRVFLMDISIPWLETRWTFRALVLLS